MSTGRSDSTLRLRLLRGRRPSLTPALASRTARACSALAYRVGTHGRFTQTMLSDSLTRSRALRDARPRASDDDSGDRAARRLGRRCSTC